MKWVSWKHRCLQGMRALRISSFCIWLSAHGCFIDLTSMLDRCKLVKYFETRVNTMSLQAVFFHKARGTLRFVVFLNVRGWQFSVWLRFLCLKLYSVSKAYLTGVGQMSIMIYSLQNNVSNMYNLVIVIDIKFGKFVIDVYLQVLNVTSKALMRRDIY